MLPQIEAEVRKAIRRLRFSKGLPQIELVPVVGPSTMVDRTIWTDYGFSSSDVVRNLLFDNDNRTPIWVGLNHPFNKTVAEHVLVSDCLFRNRRNWASRSYRTKSIHFANCAFLGTDPEHDIYHNLAGGDISVPALAVTRSFHLDTAGQVIQAVNRASDWYGPTPAEDLAQGGPIIVDRLIAINPGHSVLRPSNRAGFSLSFFESKNDVTLTNVLVDKSMQLDRSSGCLYIERRERATLDNVNFLVRNAWQPCLKMRDVEQVTISNSHFIVGAGNANLEFEGCLPRLFNCTGAAFIKLDGRVVSTVQEYSKRL